MEIDSDIMASGPSEVDPHQAQPETSEECPGKKKSKFQTFKNFFAKKKRKTPATSSGDSPLKQSQSSDDVNAPDQPKVQTSLQYEMGSKVSLGNKALSHDSVFISDAPSSENTESLVSSQDNLPGKVKTLQLQLQQAIRMGSPSAVISCKKAEDAGTLSEDDGLPRSPPEISTLHTVLMDTATGSSNPAPRNSSVSLDGTDSEDEQMSLETSSRPGSPMSPSILLTPTSPSSLSLVADFSVPASPLACLDNSAAKHRINVKHKARIKRKPASRDILGSCEKKESSGTVPQADDQNLSAKQAPIRLSSGEEGMVVEQRNAEECITKDNESTEAEASVPVFLPEDSLQHEKDSSSESSEDGLLNEESLELKEELDGSDDILKTNIIYVPDVYLEPVETSETVTSVLADSCTLEHESCSRQALTLEDDKAHSCLVTNAEDAKPDVDDIEEECHIAVEEGAKSFSEEILSSLEGSFSLLHRAQPEEDIQKEHTSTELLEDVTKSPDSFCNLEDSYCPNLSLSVVEDPLNEDQGQQEDILTEHPDTDDGNILEDRSSGKHHKESEEIHVSSNLLDENNVKLTDKTCEGSCDSHGEMGRDSDQNEDSTDPLSTHEILLPEEHPSSDPSEAIQTNSSQESSTIDELSLKICSKSEFTDTEKEEQETVVITGHSEALKRTPSKIRFTIAPAWQRSFSGSGQQKDPTNTSPIMPEQFEGVQKDDLDPINMVASLDSSPSCANEVKDDPNTIQPAVCPPSKVMPSNESQSSENRFGIKLRRTSGLLKYNPEPSSESATSPTLATTKGASSGSRPLLPKKPDLSTDKSDRPSGRVTGDGSTPPGWISSAKQKQKVFQDHTLEKSFETQSSIEGDVTRSSPDDKVAVAVKAPGLPVSGSSCQQASQVVALEKESKRTLMHPQESLLSQEGPPWLALAKKKAKAWSEMPQIVQ
uniref:Zgc:66433 n=1 Tax=Erpetoichthys calabaricus TaxID=27687 RepID=A0A8C4SI36_ERPCA